MRYRVLLPTPKGGSRLTETVGINGKQMVFNKAIQKKMKISSFGDTYLGLAVNEDGFLCLTVLKENAARTAFRVTAPEAKRRGRPVRGATRTPPDGWPGGGGLDAYENAK